MRSRSIWPLMAGVSRCTTAARRTSAEQVVAEIVARGRRAIALQADLADEAQAAGLVGRAARTARTGHAAGQQCRDLRARPAGDRRCDLLAAPHRDQSASAPGPDPGPARPIARRRARRLREHHQPDRSAGAQPDAQLYLLFGLQGRPVGAHAASCAGPRAARAGQWDRPGHRPAAARRDRGGSGRDASGDAAATGRRASTRSARRCGFILATPAMTGQMIALDGGQHLGWLQPGQTEQPT